MEVEFALKTKTNPIGVAEYQLQPKLPSGYKGRLPTAKQLADVVRDAKAEKKSNHDVKHMPKPKRKKKGRR